MAKVRINSTNTDAIISDVELEAWRKSGLVDFTILSPSEIPEEPDSVKEAKAKAQSLKKEVTNLD